MTLIEEKIAIKISQVNGYKTKSKILVLQCDQCQDIFEQSYLLRKKKQRFHFCSMECQINAQKKDNVLDKYKESIFIENHVVSNPFKSLSIKEKISSINMERYGVEFSCQNDLIKNKIIKTNIEKYGCSNPFGNKDIQNKIKQSMIDKYGVENSMSIPETREKMKNTNLELYGVEYALQSEQFKIKFKNTMSNNFGVDAPMKSETIKKKIKSTNIEKYGGPAPMCSPALVKQAHETRKRNGSYGTSKEENALYNLLCDKFKIENVYRQIKIETWLIDFYVGTIKLYIEYNGSFYHLLKRDIEVVKNSNKKIDKNIYATYLRDREKVKYFKENQYNLLVITDTDVKNKIVIDMLDQFLV